EEPRAVRERDAVDRRHAAAPVRGSGDSRRPLASTGRAVVRGRAQEPALRRHAGCAPQPLLPRLSLWRAGARPAALRLGPFLCAGAAARRSEGGGGWWGG